jgi:hypothetical protein
MFACSRASHSLDGHSDREALYPSGFADLIEPLPLVGDPIVGVPELRGLLVTDPVKPPVARLVQALLHSRGLRAPRCRRGNSFAARICATRATAGLRSATSSSGRGASGAHLPRVQHARTPECLRGLPRPGRSSVRRSSGSSTTPTIRSIVLFGRDAKGPRRLS